MAANDWGEHGVCCGFVAWTRDEWLSHTTRCWTNCAGWLAEESARTGIPLVKISGADINAGRAGVCGHWDTSQAGSGSDHTDPEPNFPWDHVLALATGGAPDTRPPETVPANLGWFGGAAVARRVPGRLHRGPVGRHLASPDGR